MQRKKLALYISIILISVGVVGGIYFTYFAGAYTINCQTLTSTDGTKLASWVYTPKDTSSNNLAGIVVAHGFTSNKQLMQGFSIELVKCGFVVIAFDFRGHGGSSGNLDIEGESLIGDVYAAVEYLRSLSYVNNNSIGLVGHSMGGAAVMNTAIQYQNKINATVTIGMVGTNESYYQINGTAISNLLIAMGGLEELFTQAEALNFLKNATALDSVEAGVTYGDFQYGNATKLYIAPWADHILEMSNAGIINETCTWFRSSFYTGSTPSITNNWRQIFIIVASLGMVLCFFVFITYLKPVVYKNKTENPWKVEDPNCKKKILCYIGGYCLINLIALLLILPLSFIFASSLNLIMSNFLIGLFLGYAIGLFFVFYLIHRYVEKDPRPFLWHIKEQISHNFSRSVLFGFLVFLFTFGTITAILHWSIIDLFPTTREIGAIITVAFMIFPYIFFDQLYIRNLQSHVSQGRIRELLKVVILSTIAKLLLFIPIMFINLGFTSLVLMILLIAFPILEIFATWIYMYSGRNIISPAIYITLLFSWIMVALMPFGNYNYFL
ncbi:MAG: alpha/beta hydrolase [Promethearchaeota archaeon]